MLGWCLLERQEKFPFIIFERSLRNTAQRQPMKFDDLWRTSGSRGESTHNAFMCQCIFVSPNSKTLC